MGKADNERSMGKTHSDLVFSSKHVNNADSYVSDPKTSDAHEKETSRRPACISTESSSTITPFSQMVNKDGIDKSVKPRNSESTSHTKFLSSNPSASSEDKLENALSSFPMGKAVSSSISAEKSRNVQVTCSPSKSEASPLPSKSQDTKEKGSVSTLKRELIPSTTDLIETGSPPERKRYKSETFEEPNQVVSSVKLSKVTEPNCIKESSSLSKHSLSESSHPSIKTSVNKNILGYNEGSSGSDLHKPKSDLNKESVEEAMGKLFGSTSNTPTKSGKNEGVTISPVRCKDSISMGQYNSSSNDSSNSSNSSRLKLLPSLNSGSEKSTISSTVTSSPSSKASETRLPSSPGPTSGSSIGSVTITKLSTGSSLNVKSKDLKNILGASNSDSKVTSLDSNNSGLMSPIVKNKLSVSKASGIHDLSFDNNGFSLKNPKVDLVPISDIDEPNPHPLSAMETSSLSIRSIGEKHSAEASQKKVTSPSPSSDSSSSSSASSRMSNDDGTSHQPLPFNSSTTKSVTSSETTGRAPSTAGNSSNSSSSSYSGSKKFNTSSTVSSGASKSSSPSNKLSSSVSDPNDQRNKIKCKLIRDSKDELHIEGRPKLSIRKVSTPDVGVIPSSNISRNPPGGSISIVPERKSGSAGGGKPMAKLKLSESSSDSFKRDRDSSSMSKNTTGTSSNSLPYNKPTHSSKKHSTESSGSFSMSSLTSNSSSKHSSSLSIVSASSSSSNSRSSSSTSSNVKTINFPSHHSHGGKPITMKSNTPSNSSTKSLSSGSSTGSGNVQKPLSSSSSSSSKTSSAEFGKSDYSTGSKLKIKLSVNSGNNGHDGKSSLSGSSTNIKSGSESGKLSNSGSTSHLSLDNKEQFTKSSGGNISECDNGDPSAKNSSRGSISGGNLSGDHEPPSGFPSFDFAGKPTYSPSRVEPNPSMVASVTNTITTNPNANSVQPTKGNLITTIKGKYIYENYYLYCKDNL